jgi:ribosomal RNA-processing protein 9
VGATAAEATSGPEWVKPAARAASRHALLAVAVSSDGALLAVGGGDRKVHLYDARNSTFIQSFAGHRCVVQAGGTLWKGCLL